jgi:two-component system LytT family response regulator
MNILIIEDEPAAATRLKRMLLALDSDIQIEATLVSVEDSVNWVKDHQEPDLIFMDIQLEDGQSFEILETVKISCPVIFTTAYDQFAVRAFQYTSVDYLLKPYKEEELARALMKFKTVFNQKPDMIDYSELLELLEDRKSTKQDRLLVQIGTQLHSIALRDAAYFYTHLKSVYLVTFNGKKYIIDYKLDQLENILDRSKFFRINRQFIVHIEAINKMHAYSKSRVKLVLEPPAEHETIVSTIRSPEFKKWLSG